MKQLLTAPDALRRLLGSEFPSVAALADGPDRRKFLKFMAASLAMAGLAGCDESPDQRDSEVPRVTAAAGPAPGVAASYASVALIDGFANGILVTTRNGRPLKIEGNPDHPWSRGGTDVFGQACVLGLYDPARSQSVMYLSRPSTWQSFRGRTIGRFAELRAAGGRGLRLLTGPVTSPTLLAQIAAMQSDFPQMRWHVSSPVDRTAIYEGARRAFGRRLETRWRFDRAKTIVSFDGDFLDAGPLQVGVSRGWADARLASARTDGLLTMHAVAAFPTLTAAKADFPLTANQADIARLAQTLLDEPTTTDSADPIETWRRRAAAALRAAGPAALVIAGAAQPASVHEAAHRLNAQLGSLGTTVFTTAPVVPPADSLADLAEAIDRHEVQALVMLDANPVYDAPGSLDFARRLATVDLKIHAGLYQDETSVQSDWHLPLAHPLESWGDARAPDGTVGLMQPTIAPLFGGRTSSEILSLLADPQPREALDLLRAHWRGDQDDADFALKFQAALQAGFWPDTAFAEEAVQPIAAAQPERPAPVQGLDLIFRPDPTVWDGSLANNAWLQELPKPLTKLVWSNALFVSPALAAREHLVGGDVIEVSVGNGFIEGPVAILPGQADNSVMVTLGYGRRVPDALADGLGFDAYPLRNHTDPWRRSGARLRKTGRSVSLAATQDLAATEGHDFIRVQRIGAQPVGDTTAFTQPTLYKTPDNGQNATQGPSEDRRAWGMVIDLDACIGCNACITACQAENNIAVVGPEEVAKGRDMHWLRVDRYIEPAGNHAHEFPRTNFQPVPCMHCEQAPCEVGCPVEATLHDSEGLNLMVYNRCVGTRACSGYCPYKVRRFNYYDYSAGAAPSLQLQRNPDVTVRSRGVMEKCTYCVQRIAEARIDADKSGIPIADGVVTTACQGACPTRAISFGDLDDAGSEVHARRAEPRNYALLGELNTRPRTTYLARYAPPSEQEG
jgi:molybdopterin-containing oxidoreductase family iron-sulfur binding subunit